MTPGAGLGRDCPCGSGGALVRCCGPVVSGERLAATAAELMRSRYTAFALGETGHLVSSWHPRTRPERLDLDDTVWRGLEVVDAVDGEPGDRTGLVEFVARWSRGGMTGTLHERSRFEWRAGRWLYLDGDLTP
ncbi:YchJ family protein [Humibacillus sp. DSM 29435]|uniref:YchJ family protein n=1 Tax=Humibacillus sp. DSM 29435 TaxID=1869167 RepID=UPI0020C7DD77|nr:YchJ family metal-binding protein [Humibacillus sp. DSM 29435]